ncbi:hypothetical protein ACHAXT_012301 [Thalassiosira profunda]
MDNAAFRALVNERRPDGGKSTKEIAREAVEDEFARKRKRGGGRRGGRGGRDDYGSDSGGSSDEDTDRKWGKDKQDAEKDEKEEEPEWKRRRREKKAADGGGYRDRAKERREGKGTDYAAIEGLASSGGVEEEDRKRREELSKYLGGDEEHTHLVRGLDKALAEKVRREEMGGRGSQDRDLDDMLEEAYAQNKGEKRERDWRSTKPKTELGKSVLGYLLQKDKEGAPQSQTAAAALVKGNPTIQKSIQRSVLTFSLSSDIRRRKDAWEAPRTSVRSFVGGEGEANSRRMAPLNHHMIATIAKKLDGGLSRQKERSRYASVPKASEKNGKLSEKQPGAASGNASKDAKATAATNGNATKEEDDSDDDIFADVGEYVPQAPPKPAEPSSTAENGEHEESAGRTNGEEKSKEKQSIFDNLLQEDVPVAPVPRPPVRQLQPQRNQPKQKNKKVIDRDIFGGGQDDQLPYQKRRGPQSAAMEGVSLNTYQGGYGEELDVDFGGFEEDRRKKKRDNDGEKETGDGEEEDDEEG